MTTVYVLAHFDDEYCALPLIREQLRAGEDLWFLYAADYATHQIAERRHAESRALLASLGVGPERVVHAGRGAGGLDGALHKALAQVHVALEAALADIRPDRFVVTAYEGGHMDHDCCAAVAAELARARGRAPVVQISLYQGSGLPHPFFHAGAPLAENGPVRRVRSSPGEWLAWMAAVRFFPSQFDTWLGLWPAMFWSYARRGFGVQDLAPARVRERPHDGRLFYERMFKVPYEEVRAAIDAFLAGRG